MSISDFTKNMAIIAALSDLPNATDGLSAAQLKAKFDEGGQALKDYINAEIVAKVNAHLDEDALDDVHGLLSGGKIIEDVGSNSDGGWIRLADGTQICYKEAFIDANVAGTSTLVSDWTYPKSFIANPSLSCNHRGTSSSANTDIASRHYNSSIAPNSVNGAFVAGRNNDSNARQVRVDVMAIGRWKP